MKELIGTGVALVTPFKEDRSVDYAGLENLVEHVISNGVSYLVVLGTTGESATLTKDEKEEVKNCITKANAGRVPMVLGIGGNDTHKVSTEINTTDLSNYSAVLSVSPYYNKPTQEGIYQHYKYIAENTEAPIILYNVPSRTGSNIEADTTLRLAHDFSSIVAIKEASPDITQSSTILRNKPSDFMVISGDDEYTLSMTLAGGAGVISVIGQALTKDFSTMVQLGLEGQCEEAYTIHYNLLDITRKIYAEGNPAGIKALLKILGVCEIYTRLPLVPASKELQTSLNELYSKI